ncbi:hypothetical protein GZ77_03890 [Endozoicomonas montiporae]|uniref:Uncharacterized protein n=2 Tax=Endozoicomonas montiporae TaxID=1027273 RepID=A0A081NB94_9GAMM|nr:hypothetical protein [Endozoicomonas montiporae]AMO56556.1 hypothetical protein EZMO1_2472 [Endozoicomonas montiporae CL-33]KEQ15717.1 hypothetical protein GZ77_03890 [Endozoicomonas montiporae]
MDQDTVLKLLMYVVGFLVTWNVYLFKRTLDNERQQSKFELSVAKNYTSKEDLKEMLTSMESRLEKQLASFIKTIKG